MGAGIGSEAGIAGGGSGAARHGPPRDRGTGPAAAAPLRSLLDQAEDLVLSADLDGRITFANRAVGAALGIDADGLVGRTPREIGLFGEASRMVARRMEAALESGAGEPDRFEVLWHRDGVGQRLYVVRIVVDRGPDGLARALLVRARDLTERRRVEQELRVREHDFRTLAENSPDNIIRYGLDMRAVYCNREIEERVDNVTAQRIVGRTPTEAVPPGMLGAEGYAEQLRRTLETGEPGTCELSAPHPDGTMRINQIVFAAERDARGAICGAVAVGRDITEQVRVQEALAATEREFRSLAENAADNIMRWDTSARTRYANPAILRVLGRSLDEILGHSPREVDRLGRFDALEDQILLVARSGGPASITLEWERPGSESGPVVHEVRLVPEFDERGTVTGVLGIGRDITEQMAQMAMIESLLRTDSLTRLANRQALHERGPGMFAAARRRRNQVGVLLLDLDDFKAVNDGLGHTAGDALLCEAARRLEACLRADDLLVRLGGDEFAVLTPDVEDVQSVASVARKLHAALDAPMTLAGRAVRIGASIGVALHPNDGEGLEELLAHADSAMYHAKRIGRGRTEYYRAELSEAVQRRLLLEESMRGACDGTGLVLHFQPQVLLAERDRIVGLEALLRWEHPDLGLLTPDAFIPLAEDTGMIAPIGRWVIEEACRHAVRWNAARGEPLQVSVNVSTRQFVLDRLPGFVDGALERTGCDPHWLSVEITESALLDHSPLVLSALERLISRGIGVAIDDFGTGYSALNYLARFPIGCIKIDRSFVAGIGRGERDDELLRAFLAMAAAMRLSTIAEGIETDEQADFLLAHGCGVAQGFRFGRPMAADGIDRLLAGTA